MRRWLVLITVCVGVFGCGGLNRPYTDPRMKEQWQKAAAEPQPDPTDLSARIWLSDPPPTPKEQPTGRR
jgi:hypothetical protein